MPPSPTTTARTDVGRRRRLRAWQAAAAVLATAVLALAVALLVVATGSARGRASDAVAAADSDTADTGALGPPTAEWREQAALGWAAVRTRPEVAADHFRRAIAVDAERAEAWRGLGVALLAGTDRSAAEDALCTARSKARRRSRALEDVLLAEHVACAAPPPWKRPRKARTPSP